VKPYIKGGGISLLAENILASQEGLYFMQLWAVYQFVYTCRTKGRHVFTHHS